MELPHVQSMVERTKLVRCPDGLSRSQAMEKRPEWQHPKEEMLEAAGALVKQGRTSPTWNDV